VGQNTPAAGRIDRDRVVTGAVTNDRVIDEIERLGWVLVVYRIANANLISRFFSRSSVAIN
jgi:hypothetical protein